MSLIVSKVIRGRGAWSSVGGTLSVDGKKPGPYYKAPASGAYKEMPGYTAREAVKAGSTVDVNYYAVYMGVRGIQRQLGVPDDGVWGGNTDKAAKDYQSAHGLDPDGVVGPKTTKVMFLAMLGKAVSAAGGSEELLYCTTGHVGHESSWDPAAVGFQTPDDLGLAQINGPAHPNMSVDERLRPELALSWVTGFVADNLKIMGTRVDAIAAYLLGTTGAKQWVKANRPTMFYGVDIDAYVSSVRKAAES